MAECWRWLSLSACVSAGTDEMQNKGRNILKRLLPAFFIFFVMYGGCVFAAQPSGALGPAAAYPRIVMVDGRAKLSVPGQVGDLVFFEPGCFSAPYTADVQNYFYHLFYCEKSGDAFRLANDLATLVVLNYGGVDHFYTVNGDYDSSTDLFIDGAILVDNAWWGIFAQVGGMVCGGYCYPGWQNTTGIYMHVRLRDGVPYFYNQYSPYLFFWVSYRSAGHSFMMPLMPAMLCIAQCKSDLASAKTSIIAEGKAIFSAFAAGSGSLPCNTAICLTGKESYFQPFANGVLLLGTMASGLIVFRKKSSGRKRR